MKLILHSNQYCRRGDAVNARHLATGLKHHFGVDSLLVADGRNKNNDAKVIDSLRAEGLDVKLYFSLGNLQDLAQAFGATHAYFLKSGRYDGVYIKGIPNIVHAVFQHFEPHGDRYVYVSEWLHDHASNHLRDSPWAGKFLTWMYIKLASGSPFFPSRSIPIDWCPHVVQLPEPDPTYILKSKFGIPPHHYVIGRFGGKEEFNDPAGRQAVMKLLDSRDDISFVFFNTHPFTKHSRVFFVDTYITEKEKASVIRDCSMMINCRLAGESFGFSICEALFMGKPVIAPNVSRNLFMDAHHIELLKDEGLLYDSAEDLVEKIEFFLENPPDPKRLRARIAQFSSEMVSKRMFAILTSQ